MHPTPDILGISAKVESIDITSSGLLYTQLDPAKPEVRLIQISAPQPNCKDIHCTQETVSLDPFLLYRALSYEWGAPDNDVPDSLVFVNGFSIKTTPNLRLALRHLRYDAWYWIDALCINQDDPSERGHQVGMMTKIFEQAFAIDVWLGLQANKSDLAMDLIHEMNGLDHLIIAGSAGYGLSLQEKYGEGIKWVKSKLSDPTYSDHWKGLQNIMLRTYWTRLWIIQEIVVTPCAERVQLICGDRQTLFQNLHRLVELIYVISYSTPYFAREGTSEALIQKLKLAGGRVMVLCDHATGWQAMKMGEGNRYDTDLLRLLTDYRTQFCSDARDKVYALIGVSIQYRQHELPISYSISVEQVYKNTAKYVMDGSGELDILLYCRKQKKEPTTLPSWVPDWRQYDPFNRVIRDRMKGWKASGALSAITSISADGDILFTRGYFLGCVGDITTSFYVPKTIRNSDEGIQRSKSLLRKCLDYFVQVTGGASSDTSQLPAEPTLEAFYTTIISTTYRRKTCESLWTLEKFLILCKSLYVEHTDVTKADAAWVISNLPDLIKRFAYKGLCTVTLQKDQSVEALDHDVSEASLSALQSTPALCAASSKLNDNVVVVRGCPHPLVLRRVGEQYELIDEIYVHGYMNGEGIEKCPELDIQLI